MKVVVKAYEEKENYVEAVKKYELGRRDLEDRYDYAEEYDSITEALADKRILLRKIRKTGDWMGFMIFDTLGELKHKLVSSSVNEESLVLDKVLGR